MMRIPMTTLSEKRKTVIVNSSYKETYTIRKKTAAITGADVIKTANLVEKKENGEYKQPV